MPPPPPAVRRRRQGTRGPPPLTPPPPHPPSWGATGAALRPPWSRGGDAVGGAAAGPAPASPLWRAGATRTTEQYGGRAPHYPPVTTAHSGRAEGWFRSARAPGGAVHGPPLTPPTPGRHFGPDRTRTPEGSAPATRRGPGLSTAGRRPEGEQGGRGATAPPPPPHRPAGRGGPGLHSPRQGGWSPPRPREEPERDPPPRPSRRLPWGPRRTSEPAPTRQDAAKIVLTERSLVSTNRSRMGGHAPHGQHNASDTRFVACPGKAEGRNEAERPPALQAPPRPHNRGVRRTPPPPPSPPPST